MQRYRDAEMEGSRDAEIQRRGDGGEERRGGMHSLTHTNLRVHWYVLVLAGIAEATGALLLKGDAGTFGITRAPVLSVTCVASLAPVSTVGLALPAAPSLGSRRLLAFVVVCGGRSGAVHEAVVMRLRVQQELRLYRHAASLLF